MTDSAVLDITDEKLRAWGERIDFLLDEVVQRGAEATAAEMQLAEYLRCHRVWAGHKLDKMRHCGPEQATECQEEMDSALRAIDEVWRVLASRLKVA